MAGLSHVAQSGCLPAAPARLAGTRIPAAVLAIALLWSASAGAAPLTPDQAGSHIGENATVCGVVASARYAARSRGQPTFLNLDKPYPQQDFTAVIFGSDRAKFGTPERDLAGKRVCITGAIELYRGKPQIILRDSGQLTQP